MESIKEKCIIHTETYGKDSEPLITPKDYDSWKTLLDAAQVRNHGPILEIAGRLGEREVPNISYHRQCRSRFTLKRDLEIIKRKSAENSSDDDGSSIAAKRQHRSPCTSRVLQVKCIFCDKDKFLKGTSTRETLIQARQLRTDETLRKCAIEKQDEKILVIASRDIVAGEAHYHHSCYTNYTRKPKEIGSATKEESESESAYKKAQSDAYGNLFSFIRNEMLPDRLIVPVAKLLCRFENFMQARGIKVRDSDKKHIRRRLELEFGDILHIYKEESGKLIAVPNSVTVEDMVRENRKLEKEVKTLTTKTSDIKCIINQASCYIRSCIQENTMTSPWPYHPSNVTEESMKLPCLLQQFLTGVLTGDPENESPSGRVKLLVQSFGQDLIYAATRGQQIVHEPGPKF